jgi:hypothetical protein
LQEKLHSSGFVGVENADGVTYARINAAMPEFRVDATKDGWLFAVSWNYRATAEQRADWALRFESAPMDVDLGVTRVQKTYARIDQSTLKEWSDIMQDMVAHCVQWRRTTRQGDEGC